MHENKSKFDREKNSKKVVSVNLATNSQKPHVTSYLTPKQLFYVDFSIQFSGIVQAT